MQAHPRSLTATAGAGACGRARQVGGRTCRGVHDATVPAQQAGRVQRERGGAAVCRRLHRHYRSRIGVDGCALARPHLHARHLQAAAASRGEGTADVHCLHSGAPLRCASSMQLNCPADPSTLSERTRCHAKPCPSGSGRFSECSPVTLLGASHRATSPNACVSSASPTSAGAAVRSPGHAGSYKRMQLQRWHTSGCQAAGKLKAGSSSAPGPRPAGRSLITSPPPVATRAPLGETSVSRLSATTAPGGLRGRQGATGCRARSQAGGHASHGHEWLARWQRHAPSGASSALPPLPHLRRSTQHSPPAPRQAGPRLPPGHSPCASCCGAPSPQPQTPTGREGRAPARYAG